MSQNKNFLDVPYIETSAKVDTLVVPDRIFLNITINEKDSRGKKSVEEQEVKMGRMLERLGVDLKKQLVVKHLSSNFKKAFLQGNKVLKSKNYSLVVYDGLTAGKVLVGLEEIGIANTRLEKTEYSKMDELQLELKAKAAKKAKKKATSLTEALGQKVGAAIHIVDNHIPYYPNYRNQGVAFSKMAVDMAESAEPLDLDFEKIKVESQVNIKFKLD